MVVADGENTSKYTDQMLVQRIRQGEDAAFSILVRRYQHKVFGIVHRMLGIPEESEDLAQEVFVTFYRSVDHYRGECAVSTWLYRIAVNLCRNRLKYLKRRLFFRAEDIQETPEQQMDVRHSWSLANPEQQLMGKQLELFLQRELLQLEEEFRMVFILRDLEQLSYEHIAEITGLALGTVKSRLHRARVLLKQRLERFLKAQEPERASSSSIPELPASIARSIVS